MKNYFLVLSFCFLQSAYAQTTSTFLSSDNSEAASPLKTSYSNINPLQATTNETPAATSSFALRDHFARSLFNPQDESLGIIATFMPTMAREKENDSSTSFSANILLTSLWGIKFIHESTKNNFAFADEYSDGGEIDYKVKSYKIGINRFFPIFSNLAIETGGFYERGKIKEHSFNSYSYEESDMDDSFSAGSALVGINLTTANFIIGTQYQQRFLTSSLSNISSETESKVKSAKSLTANLGIYF